MILKSLQNIKFENKMQIISKVLLKLCLFGTIIKNHYNTSSSVKQP